jgi:hypothetical protein
MKPVNLTLGQAGLMRLENRAARLVRLLQLAAPKLVVAHEVALLVQAIEIYAPEEYFKAQSDSATERWRRALGRCAIADCDNLVLQDSSEKYCPDCWKKMEGEAKADDEEPLVADIQEPFCECESCGEEASIEIVYKDKRCWACEKCHPALMSNLGPGARSAPFPEDR